MLQLAGRWAIRLLAGILASGLLVGVAERHFRRVRRQLLNRGDEFRPERPVRPSPLAAAAQAGSDAHRGQSGHRLLVDGPEALAARLVLARAAVNTLDLQYYAWHDDLAGRLMAQAVLQAAGRGVRVRILLDDLHARSTKRLVRLLAAHPQITLRVYNPSVTRRAYFLNWLFSFHRLNRRMHNKALVADGAAAIIGGRNIGDVYFGLAANMNFRDLDVLTVGPDVQAVEAFFERFWDSEFAMPSAAFGVKEQAKEAEVDAILARLDHSIRENLRRRSGKGEPQRNAEEIFAEHRMSLNALLSDLIWATATVLGDTPGEAAGAGRLQKRLWDALSGIRNSLDIETGYFIPDEEDLARFQRLTARGVAVRVVTNSLGTNDVLPAQIGYARHRRRLLAAGVELHELQPDAKVRRALSLLGSSGGAGLHAKVMLADGHLAVIGSYNLDPRSADHNTELVLLIEDEAFARELAATMTQVRSPSQSYRVELRRGKVVWVDDGAVLTREPGATLPARLLAVCMRILPVEWLL
ncbi:phospholipase D family protein [Microvirga makkahensis]|uniref:Phospholipase D n=1 Tax=Microvirga makkahensis TaxID=1128670 RepID=A0A7X3SPN0_9HYPH|nr:phospholipase D family protein [Microvirga makkahensis]MXQ12666.1 phospholipase D family protein [Microvirga makkahensis]